MMERKNVVEFAVLLKNGECPLPFGIIVVCLQLQFCRTIYH